MDYQPVKKIVDKYKGKKTALISILHEIQDEYQFLPEGALKKLAAKMEMDLTDLYGVATFYKSFSLTPKGKHAITLCLGTACHVRGGPRILKEVVRLLNVKPGETTADGQFSLNAVNCLGVCAIGPVMVIDEKIHGEMNPLKARRIIDRLNNKKEKSKLS
jgi:NADH:ubiquinone oxidoreductase subunit E